MRPAFDERDAEILAERLAAFDARPGVRVGDFLRLEDGSYLRFTHDWGDGIQTTHKRESGSFYLGNGHADYSGSLDSAIAKDRLTDTGEKKPGWFWFFHHHDVKAHNGVYFEAPCRVFTLAEKESA